MPRPVHEFSHDGEAIYVLNPKIRPADTQDRLIWNMKGMRRLVPASVVDNALTLLEDYNARLKAFDRVPKSVGLILWEQCVPVPLSVLRDLSPLDTEPKP